MGLAFSMTAVNADKVEFALRGLRGDLLDYTKVWPEVSKEIEKEESYLFASRGVSGAHGAWPALTRRYLKRKYKKYGAQQIEVASGRLRRALTDSTSGDAIRRYFPRSMEFGTSLPYAVFQQTGWRPSHFGRWGRMGLLVDRMVGRPKPQPSAETRVPPRRVIDPGPDLGPAIVRAMSKAIDSMARKRGFATSSVLGLGKLSPGAARQLGYGSLTGTFTGQFAGMEELGGS